MAIRIEEVHSDKQRYLPLLKLADPDVHMINSYLEISTLFKICSEDELIGVAVILIDDKVAEIKNIGLEEQWQGKGIGSQALEKLIDYCVDQDCQVMTVGTANSSIDNFAFYQKNGFRFVQIIPDFFRQYQNPIYENGIRALDMLVLEREI